MARPPFWKTLREFQSKVLFENRLGYISYRSRRTSFFNRSECGAATRLYEREGLLAPSRSDGNTRLYTDEDLERLEVILKLTRELGVNLAGVEIILNMREKMEAMQRQIEHFVADLNQELVQQAAQPHPGENNSLIPVIRVNSVTTTSRTEQRRPTEARRKAVR